VSLWFAVAGHKNQTRSQGDKDRKTQSRIHIDSPYF
jgi:hypothetical protein